MDNERGPLVTYLERKKHTTTANSDTDSNMSPTKPVSKAPSTKGPKKVEVDLPGPTPKRSRRPSNESTRSTKDKPLKQKISAANSPKTFKQPEPPSPKSQKPASKAYTNDEGDFDDGASIADSTVSTNRVRRSEAERIEYFNNQPECGRMEPRAVECLRCTKTVNLGRKQTYAVRPWEIHRARCDQKPAASGASGSKEQGSVIAPPSRTTSSPVDPSPARRLTEDERKASLSGDKQVEAVEAHRVLCRKCQTWINLSEKHTYISGNWMKHKIMCSDAIPSNRVAAAKRKLLIVNDAQAKAFDVRQIGCAHCGTHVRLEGEGDYNLTSWEAHKGRCNQRSPTGKSDGVNSVPFPTPSTSARPPTSSASSEPTLIASDALLPDSPNALKRTRVEPDDPSEVEERPVNRQRSESYLPPQEDAPGALGWLLLPFQAFARGFRESLKNESP